MGDGLPHTDGSASPHRLCEVNRPYNRSAITGLSPRHAVQQRFDLVETSHVKLTALRHVLTSKWLFYSLLSWSIVIGLYALFGGGGGGFGGFFLFYEFFEAQIFLLYQLF